MATLLFFFVVVKSQQQMRYVSELFADLRLMLVVVALCGMSRLIGSAFGGN